MARERHPVLELQLEVEDDEVYNLLGEHRLHRAPVRHCRDTELVFAQVFGNCVPDHRVVVDGEDMRMHDLFKAHDATESNAAQFAFVTVVTSLLERPYDTRGERHAKSVRSAREPINMPPSTDILIIEDDAIMRGAMAEWLEAAGYRVCKAADGCAGLAALQREAPKLVITDIHMPEKSGAMVIAEVKQQYPEIPIIAISGLFDSGHGLDADAAIALGAARTLPKPFKRRDLLRAVTELIG